jgi:hypothetical protein
MKENNSTILLKNNKQSLKEKRKGPQPEQLDPTIIITGFPEQGCHGASGGCIGIETAVTTALSPLEELRSLKSVNVFSYVYEIKWVSSNKEKNEEFAWGWCDFNERVLCIDEEALLIPERAVEIFLHEWIHAGHDFFDLDDNSSEERYTNLTSKLLIEYMRTNPEVFEIINKIIHKKT